MAASENENGNGIAKINGGKNGNDKAAQHFQLKKVLGPNVAYLTTSMEIGIVKAFIDFHLFDNIPLSTPISHTALAAAIQGEKELLDRTVPLLVTAGILLAPEKEHVAHTERSLTYRTGELGAGMVVHMHNLFLRSMTVLPEFLAQHGFRSPTDAQVTPFGLATGKPKENVYEIIAGDTKLSKEFDSFISRVSKVYPMIGVHDFSWMKEAGNNGERILFVDIGGSNGHAVRDVLVDHPWMQPERTAVFDRPATIEATRAVGDRDIRGVQLVSGNAMEGLPKQIAHAVAYQLRRILNDFADDNVRLVWKALEKAALPDTRVYVVEELLQENRNAYGIAQDLSLLLVGGKRRSAEMHAELADEAGFRLARTYADTHNDCEVLEFVVSK